MDAAMLTRMRSLLQLKADEPTSETRYDLKPLATARLALLLVHTCMPCLVARQMLPAAMRVDCRATGRDAGVPNRGVIASLVQTCKLNAVDPHTLATRGIGTEGRLT